MTTEPPITRNGQMNASAGPGADQTPVDSDRTHDATASRPLVVLDPDAPAASLRAALGHLDASDQALDLLVVYPIERFEARRAALIEAGATGYAVSDLKAEARREARRVGHEWLSPLGISFEAIGAVGEVRDCVPITIAERGYSRVYVKVPRRTFWQRLRGVPDRMTALDDTLPKDVDVVPLDWSGESDVEITDLVPDGELSADAAVTPNHSIEM